MGKMKFLFAFAILPLFLLLSSLPARPAAFSYATRKRQIKVCNLLIPSANLGNVDPNTGTWPDTVPENSDPYVWYVLDNHPMKPPNWEFINPLAPKQVTFGDEVYERWHGRYLHSGLGALWPPPGWPTAPGQSVPVTKNMGCYWEVVLSEKRLNDLLQFDLIFITNHRTWTFSTTESDMLRRVVDAGAQIWLDDCSGLRIGSRPDAPSVSSFFIDLQFHNDGPSGTAVIVDRQHPLLTSPYWLSYEEIANLGDKGRVNNYYMSNFVPPNQPGSAPPDPRVLQPIVNNSGPNLPYIAAGRYGSGFIIATSRDIGCAINDPCGGLRTTPAGQNSGVFAGENITNAKPWDVKFACNMVNWSFSWVQFRRNTRHTAESGLDLPAPLSRKWAFPPPGTGTTLAFLSSPCIYKNIMYIGAQDGYIYAFDVEPAEDLDSDGNADDGVSDANFPQFDIVWRFPTSAPVHSSPAVAAIYFPAVGATREVVFAADSSGSLYALDAFTGASIWSAPLGAQYPSSPTVSRNAVYICAGNTVNVVDATTGTPLSWTNAGIPNAGVFTASPATVLWYDSRTGALDEVVYVGDTAGNFYALLFRVENERLRPTDATNTVFNSRRQRYIGWWQILEVRVNGVPQLPGSYIADPGSRRIQFPSSQPAGAVVTVSYIAGFDPDGNGPGAPAGPGVLKWDNDENEIPEPFVAVTPPNPPAPINSSPALSVDNYIYFGADDGYVYCLRDRGYRFARLWQDEVTGQFWGNTGAPVRTSPAIGERLIYVGNDSGYLFALNRFGGGRVWGWDPRANPLDPTTHIPSAFRASPILVGDVLYAVAEVQDLSTSTWRSLLYAFDPDPRDIYDANTATWKDEKGNPILWDNTLSCYWGQTLGTGPVDLGLSAQPMPDFLDIRSSPAVSGGVFAIGTLNYASAFSSPLTLVVDNTRLLEVDSASNVHWACDGTYEGTWVAVPDPNNPGGELIWTVVVKPKPFSRLSKSQKITYLNYLVVDTGNDRVVEIDKAGDIVWQLANTPEADADGNSANGYQAFLDLYNLLAPSEPLTLKSPTEARLVFAWDYNPAPGRPAPGYDYFYLIVDSDNYRILLIRRSDKVLVWTSNTAALGKRYRYISAEPLFDFDPSNHWVFLGVVCALDNWRVNLENGKLIEKGAGGSAGMIEGKIYDSTDGSGGKGNFIFVGSQIPFDPTIYPNHQDLPLGELKQIISLWPPQRFSRLPDSQWLLVDRGQFQANTPAQNFPGGIYRVLVNLTATPPIKIIGKLSNEDYRELVKADVSRIYGTYGTDWKWKDDRAPALHPISAQFLPNGNILVVNQNYAAYQVVDATTGTKLFDYPASEIIEIEPQPDGSYRISWRCPKFGPEITGTFILNQPAAVQRLQ